MDSLLAKFSNSIFKIALFFVKVAIWLVIIYFLGMKCYNFGHRLFREEALSKEKTESIEFTIKDGDTAEVIAENLQKCGLIDDTLVFRFRSKIYKTVFNPNTYSLDKSMTIKQMLDVFDEADSQYVVVPTTTEQAEDVYQLSPEDQDYEEEGE